jgi:hypothetical protein
MPYAAKVGKPPPTKELSETLLVPDIQPVRGRGLRPFNHDPDARNTATDSWLAVFMARA